MSIAGLAVAAIALAVGGLLQGSIGFGFGTFAAPLLALVDPRFVPGPLLCTALVVTLLVAWRERVALQMGEIGWAVLGRIPGAAIGTVAVAFLPREGISIALAVVVLSVVVVSVGNVRLRRTTWTLVGAGVASGAMSTTTSVGGPPLALLYQDAPGPALRGTLSGFFLVGVTVSLTGLWLAGELHASDVRWGALMVVPMLIGYAFSRRVARFLDRGWSRWAVLGVCAVSSVVLLVRETIRLLR